MTKHDVTEDFRKNTASHVMEVVRDDGLNRHLRFRKPGTYCYGFDIVTWPGYLAITGDMGASVFCRLDDMFAFFRSESHWKKDHPGELFINTGYWAEKLVANDGDARRYDRDLFRAEVKRRFDDWFEDRGELSPAEELAKAELWEDIEQNVLHDEDHEYAAHESVRNWTNTSAEFPSFQFHDFWESTLTDYTFHLRWRLHAIAWAIEVYDARQIEAPTITYSAPGGLPSGVTLNPRDGSLHGNRNPKDAVIIRATCGDRHLEYTYPDKPDLSDLTKE